MTGTMLLILVAVVVGTILGILAANRRGRSPIKSSDGPPAGPWAWDAGAVAAGVALGSYLRLTLGRTAPVLTQTLVSLAGLLIVGSLTFVRWPKSSPMRGLLLPLIELLVAAWGASGTASM
jgi:hypothetical protein